MNLSDSSKAPPPYANRAAGRYPAVPVPPQMMIELSGFTARERSADNSQCHRRDAPGNLEATRSVPSREPGVSGGRNRRSAGRVELREIGIVPTILNVLCSCQAKVGSRHAT